MSFKHAAAIAAVLSIVAPSITPASATGSRLDRGENAERRKAKQAAAAETETPEWHYADGSAQVGPLTQAELIAAAEAGTVKKDTQVFHPDAGWRAAAQVPELKDIAK